MLQKAIRIDRDAIYPLHVAVTQTGLSRESLRDAIKRQQLAATRRGKCWFVRGQDLEDWLITPTKTNDLAGSSAG